MIDWPDQHENRAMFWLVFMAEANLMLLFFPTILFWLFAKLAEISQGLTHQWEWNHICLTAHHYPMKHCKKMKARQPSKIEDQASQRSFHMPTYLQHLALIASKVGCQVKCSMRPLKAALTIKRLPNLVATADNLPYQVPRIRFDMDSFVIGIDTFALVMMGNRPDQFEDLIPHKDKDNTEMEGTKGGLAIKGTGTF
jgi:hypothetical protein